MKEKKIEKQEEQKKIFERLLKIMINNDKSQTCRKIVKIIY